MGAPAGIVDVASVYAATPSAATQSTSTSVNPLVWALIALVVVLALLIVFMRVQSHRREPKPLGPSTAPRPTRPILEVIDEAPPSGERQIYTPRPSSYYPGSDSPIGGKAPPPPPPESLPPRVETTPMATPGSGMTLGDPSAPPMPGRQAVEPPSYAAPFSPQPGAPPPDIALSEALTPPGMPAGDGETAVPPPPVMPSAPFQPAPRPSEGWEEAPTAGSAAPPESFVMPGAAPTSVPEPPAPPPMETPVPPAYSAPEPPPPPAEPPLVPNLEPPGQELAQAPEAQAPERVLYSPPPPPDVLPEAKGAVHVPTPADTTAAAEGPAEPASPPAEPKPAGEASPEAEEAVPTPVEPPPAAMSLEAPAGPVALPPSESETDLPLRYQPPPSVVLAPPDASPEDVIAPAEPGVDLGPGLASGPEAEVPAAEELAVSPAEQVAAGAAAAVVRDDGRDLILLIEDDERISKFYSMLFESKGFSVRNAKDGVEGVDLASSLLPELILLDVMMPKMNGLMVLQAIRANPDTEKTPVVVLSNYMEPPLIQRALQLGAIEYVVKSQARPEQLVEALPNWILGKPALH